MSGEGWLCRTPAMFDAFCKHIHTNWDFSRPLLVNWQDGKMKSQGQLALCHVWIRALTDYINAKKGTDYDEETMKTCLKREYGIRLQIIDPITGKESASLKSLSKYEKGEMFDFMTQIDRYAAGIGCIFPVWGEYEKLKRESR